MELYVFALLPLGLASLFSRRLPRSTAAFGFLAALAPVVAKGFELLTKHKQASAAQKNAQAQAKAEAAAADARARSEWEAAQNSPANQLARFKSTLALGKLAGHLGGMGSVPKSIAAYYQSQRTMPQYTGLPSYVEPVKPGGGGWNLASGIVDALGYFDPSQIGKGKVPKSPGQPTYQTPPPATFQTGQLSDLLRTAGLRK